MKFMRRVLRVDLLDHVRSGTIRQQFEFDDVGLRYAEING